MAVLLGSIDDRIDKIKVFEATSFAENDSRMYDILMNV